jgi:hypothetical protein
MPEKKKTIKLAGLDINVVEVLIKKATEFFNEYELEDGTFLRVKGIPTSISRIEGQYAEGKPLYIVVISPVVVVDTVPENLMEKRPKQQ